MSSREKIIDDVARAAGGAVGIITDAGREARAVVRSKIDHMAQDMDLVPRDEFEKLEALVIRLREEQETLKQHIAELEKKNKT